MVICVTVEAMRRHAFRLASWHDHAYYHRQHSSHATVYSYVLLYIASWHDHAYYHRQHQSRRHYDSMALAGAQSSHATIYSYVLPYIAWPRQMPNLATILPLRTSIMMLVRSGSIVMPPQATIRRRTSTYCIAILMLF